MTDDKDKLNKQKEIDEFFEQFDRISNEFDKSMNKPDGATELSDSVEPTVSDSTVPPTSAEPRKTRIQKLEDSKPNTVLTEFLAKFKKDTEKEVTMAKNAKEKKKKKYTLNKKQFFKFLLVAVAAMVIIFGGIIGSIIIKATPIKPNNIYELLAENSVLYDDEGNVIDSLLTSNKEQRTNVSYSDLPDNLINAFVAIEDKTFWDHNGFNVIRIMGAIKESITDGGTISGTSTITQQLARNLYLAETKSDRSMTRKIKEAYYTVQLERHLSKEQIMEAYLNTIYLGFGTNGVQAASQAYFSKDVKDLTLTECAALASLPKAPDKFALIKRYDNEKIQPDNPNIVKRGDEFTLVYNNTVHDRKDLVLKFMKEQELIGSDEYDSAKAEDLKASINPGEDKANELSYYFADYAIDEVIADLMKEYNYSKEEARLKIQNSGLRIYTTLNANMQKIAEKEFSNNANFPKVAGLKKDKAGNVLNSSGNILLYSYNQYFDGDGNFVLGPDEYQSGDEGDLILLKGKRLNFYKVEVQGNVDYNIEFKDMYVVEDGVFYSIKGGVINIPQEYKSKDADGNLVIRGKFFEDYPDFFQFTSSGMAVSGEHYTLKQKVNQPQSAMVIFDYKSGGIKAMVGGRNTEGRLLYNRAVKPRQPGSAIKPMGVYAPALQSGVDAMKSGTTNTNSEGNGYGKLWTAASVIDDAPLTIQGKLWPKNWYSGYRGLQTLRKSVEQSVNVNAVKVFSEIGVQKSVNFLKDLGVTTIAESGDVNDMNAAALGLGGMTYGISPLEMAAGYGAFANQGFYTEPAAYTKVTNKRGEVILEKTPKKKQVMDKGVAFIMTDILRTTVTDGIAKGAAIGTQPVAGKTGTTTDNYDAWFVGFTPQYAASLWIGNDVNIELSQGSAAAAKVWSKIMKQVHAGIPQGSFPTADNVISVAIDTISGRLPSDLSALDPRGTVRNEYFVKGTEPTTTDNIHVSATVCSESNYLATPYCPNPVTKVFVRRPGGHVSNVGDNNYTAPAYYCHLHNLDPAAYPINPSETLSSPGENENGFSFPFPIDGNNGNGNGNGNGNNGNGSGNGNKPDWLDFLD